MKILKKKLKDVVKFFDFLSNEDGYTIFVQTYLDDTYLFEFDSGDVLMELSPETVVSVRNSSELFINGKTYSMYRSVLVNIEE